MVWSHRGVTIPLHVWHGVPAGWRAEEIRAEHRRLHGTFDIGGPEATEPGAPDWLPDRHAWLQYRATLYRVADGVTADDAACVELAIRFLELHHIGSYGGYVRSKFARRLKHVELTAAQRSRLHEHFSRLLARGERVYEFVDYLPLWRQVATREQWQQVRERFAASGNAWLRSRLAARAGS
ncbi:MAG: hypothetical protein NXI31_00470 [bacterium]|nr:hypothetical protein [bacterium]